MNQCIWDRTQAPAFKFLMNHFFFLYLIYDMMYYVVWNKEKYFIIILV